MAGAKERYSFSKLRSFEDCPYGYYLEYVLHQKGIQNGFATYGSEVHSIMERYANGELALDQLMDTYIAEFPTAVPEPFPPSFVSDLKKLYYDQGLKFFENFEGYDCYDILDVERSFDTDVDDWVFNGIIDLIYEDDLGRLVIQDYKSKSSFKSKQERTDYAKQLYLYCLYIKEKYGKYPDILRFSLFRKSQLVDIPFKEADLDAAVNWARGVVHNIRNTELYKPSCDEFFGNNLCNFRESCEYKAGGKDDSRQGDNQKGQDESW